jgi:hypothetical protein
MEAATNPRAAPLAPEAKLGLWILAVTLVVIGFPLVVLTKQTDTYFSWTIQPPLTAAVLGACYWGSAALVLTSARRSTWAYARVAVPGIVVAGVFLLLATLLHHDRFHMDSATGWAWLVLYALLPPSALVLFSRQRSAPGGDPVRAAPMSRWAIRALAMQGVVLLGFGVALFVAPVAVGEVWPWTLSPLTGRAIGAWLMAIGASAAQAAWEGDWDRVKAGMLGYAAIATLELAMLMRFSGTPDWGDPSAWVLIAFLVAMLVTGVAGFVAAVRAGASAQPPPGLGVAVRQ